MRVIVLGCGGSAGVPMIGGADGQGTGIWGRCDPTEPRNARMRSSVVIEADDGFRLLIDSGPDFRTQMLRFGVGRVDAVLYTHPHADHTAGLDELRSINRVLGHALPLYAGPEVVSELQSRFAYAFKPWTGPDFFRPVFDVHEIGNGDTLEFGSLSAQVFAQHHGKIMSFGLRFGSVAYCTDVDTMPEEALEILSGVDTWFVDCFQYAPHPAHAWLDRVLEWRSLIGARRTILTHMGPDMDYQTLRQTLPDDVEPAHDGMVLTMAGRSDFRAILAPD